MTKGEVLGKIATNILYNPKEINEVSRTLMRKKGLENLTLTGYTEKRESE